MWGFLAMRLLRLIMKPDLGVLDLLSLGPAWIRMSVEGCISMTRSLLESNSTASVGEGCKAHFARCHPRCRMSAGRHQEGCRPCQWSSPQHGLVPKAGRWSGGGPWIAASTIIGSIVSTVVGSCLGRLHNIKSAPSSSLALSHDELEWPSCRCSHAEGLPSQAQALAAPSNTWNFEERCAKNSAGVTAG